MTTQEQVYLNAQKACGLREREVTDGISVIYSKGMLDLRSTLREMSGGVAQIVMSELK